MIRKINPLAVIIPVIIIPLVTLLCLYLPRTTQALAMPSEIKPGTIKNATSQPLEAVKTVYPSQAHPGDHLTYTVRITNTSGTLLWPVWMSDTLPALVSLVPGSITATMGTFGVTGDTITWNITLEPTGTVWLPSMQSAALTFTVQITPGLKTSVRLTNTAEITAAGSLVRAEAGVDVVRRFIVWLPVIMRNYPPVLNLHPIPDPVNRAYTVSWDGLLVPFDVYVLQQARTPGFETVDQEWQTTSASQYVENTYCAYYYRVRADYAAGWGIGPWSPVRQGKAAPPDPPTLNEVPAPNTDRTFVINWSSVNIPVQRPGVAVDRYVLQEAFDPEFKEIRQELRTSQTWLQLSGASSYGAFYYRVRADDDDCWGAGPWSNIRRGAAVPPDPPVLNQQPRFNAADSYLVSWSPVSVPSGVTVDHYVLQESTSPDFASVRREWVVPGTSQAVPLDWTYRTLYYRVRADSARWWGEGPWSSVLEFYITYFDDFSDPESGWSRMEVLVIPDTGTHYRLRYEYGHYRIMIDQGGPYIWFHQPDALAPFTPPSDKYCVETTMRFEKGQPPYTQYNYYPYWANAGIVFGANDANTDLYALCLSVGSKGSMGWFVVHNPSYSFPRKGCSYKSGVIPGEDGGLNADKWYKLQASVDGDTVTIYINGVYKGTYTMPWLSSMTRVGVVGGDYEITPVDVRFDYFKVTPDKACVP